MHNGRVTERIAFTTRADAEIALNSDSLIPPPKPTSLLPGATADLRDAMARFSAAPVHAQRRAAVVLAIDQLNADRLRQVAAERAALRLRGDRIDAVADLAYVVPTEAICSMLDADADLADVLADTLAVVKVIARGEPSSESSDSAADRLLLRFAAHPMGAVPAVSLLYQTHDATAALTLATIVARDQGSERRCAITSTVRVATQATTIGTTAVAAGSVVTIVLDTSGYEFGAGPHRCPGQHLAEAIVDGIMDALDAGNYRMLTDLAVFNDAGRPTTLPMEP